MQKSSAGSATSAPPRSRTSRPGSRSATAGPIGQLKRLVDDRLYPPHAPLPTARHLHRNQRRPPLATPTAPRPVRPTPAGLEHANHLTRIAAHLEPQMPGWRLMTDRELRPAEHDCPQPIASVKVGEGAGQPLLLIPVTRYEVLGHTTPEGPTASKTTAHDHTPRSCKPYPKSSEPPRTDPGFARHPNRRAVLSLDPPRGGLVGVIDGFGVAFGCRAGVGRRVGAVASFRSALAACFRAALSRRC